MLSYLRTLSLALWLGSSIAMFLSTPVLFASLDRAQAGSLAGGMLRRIEILRGACALAIVGVAIASPPSGARLAVEAAMVGGFAAESAIVNRRVRALRGQPGTSFGAWHGASMVLMLAEAILAGAALRWRG